mgnify:CR=1 FL=1
MTAKILLLILLAFSNFAFAEERLTFGRYQSRAIFHEANPEMCPAPLVILIPGSGANGPEKMIPGGATIDGKDHSVFGAFSEGLRRGNVGTLAVGKPGVDFFKSWKPEDRFYNQELYRSLRWQDLINNLSDAVNFAKTLPCVDPNRIYVLGHSEGTQVAVDFAEQEPNAVRGLILVGFSGENLATTIDWRLFRRVIDSWLTPDVDTNKDGFISRTEAAAWPEFHWEWQPNQDAVSLEEIERYLTSHPELKKEFEELSLAPIWQGVFYRDPIYEKASQLAIDLFVFTGALDVQTRPEEALRLNDACVKAGKLNCVVEIVPGLGHAMSKPKGPRGHKLLDSTLGPVDESFKVILAKTASMLF